MNIHIEKLNSILKSLHIDATEQIRTNQKKFITLPINLLILTTSAFLTASITFFLNIEHLLLLAAFMHFGISGSGFYLHFKSAQKKNQYSLNANTNELKNDALEKINKNLIFDLFITFEKLLPLLSDKTIIAGLKKDLENIISDPDYKNKTFNSLYQFKISQYENLITDIQTNMEKEQITKEFHTYKNELEINSELSTLTKLKKSL